MKKIILTVMIILFYTCFSMQKEDVGRSGLSNSNSSNSSNDAIEMKVYTPKKAKNSNRPIPPTEYQRTPRGTYASVVRELDTRSGRQPVPPLNLPRNRAHNAQDNSARRSFCDRHGTKILIGIVGVTAVVIVGGQLVSLGENMILPSLLNELGTKIDDLTDGLSDTVNVLTDSLDGLTGNLTILTGSLLQATGNITNSITALTDNVGDLTDEVGDLAKNLLTTVAALNLTGLELGNIQGQLQNVQVPLAHQVQQLQQLNGQLPVNTDALTQNTGALEGLLGGLGGLLPLNRPRGN